MTGLFVIFLLRALFDRNDKWQMSNDKCDAVATAFVLCRVLFLVSGEDAGYRKRFCLLSSFLSQIVLQAESIRMVNLRDVHNPILRSLREQKNKPHMLVADLVRLLVNYIHSERAATSAGVVHLPGAR